MTLQGSVRAFVQGMVGGTRVWLSLAVLGLLALPPLIVVEASSPLSLPVTGEGTAGQVAYWTDTRVISGEDSLFWDSAHDRLGVGTTAPSSRLTVSGDVAVSGSLVSGSVPWARLTQFPPACSAGSFVTAAGPSLGCAQAGDITAVTAGPGLTGGGSRGDASLEVDPDVVQSRVTGTCAAGAAIRVINADGTVACGGSGPGWQRLARTSITGTSSLAVDIPDGCLVELCRVVIVRYDAIRPQTIGLVEFLQESTFWLTYNRLNGDSGGVNGNGVTHALIDVGDCRLEDDSATENSATQWTLVDPSSSFGCNLRVFT